MKTNRAYSLLRVKSVDDEERIIRGMATTPEVDRQGDILDPMGAKVRNPSPLLWMHDPGLPVGQVTFGLATNDGIPFTARLPKVNSPAGLRDRIEEAWASVKSGLVAGVSIGFRPLEWSLIEETGGFKFLKSEILELSLVTIPANSGATISEIKAFDLLPSAAPDEAKSSDKVDPQYEIYKHLGAATKDLIAKESALINSRIDVLWQKLCALERRLEKR